MRFLSVAFLDNQSSSNGIPSYEDFALQCISAKESGMDMMMLSDDSPSRVHEGDGHISYFLKI